MLSDFSITDKPRCTEDGEARYTQLNRKLQVPTTQLAKVSFDPKFVELTADVLEMFLLNRQCTTKGLVHHNSAPRLQWTEEGEGSLEGSRAHRITTFLSKLFFSIFSVDR